MAGLALALVICMAILLSGKSSGDPDLPTGVASVYPETGTWPFAHARAEFYGLDAGVQESVNAPIFTAMVGWSMDFFGDGFDSLKIFSVIPLVGCLLLVAFALVRRRGEAVGILAALVVALQPTLLPWASVPNTIPLAALSVLALALFAGARWKPAPWVALFLCALLQWGISPLIVVVAPACWIEGVRRSIPRHLRPEGWVLTLLAAAILLSLRQVGADPINLAAGLTGCTDLYRSGAVPSIFGSDPGWLLAVLAVLIAGPRGRDEQFRPMRMTLVAGLLPWLLSGTLPVFPLVVLIPIGILLTIDQLASRGRTVIATATLAGTGPRLALTLFVVTSLLVASLASSGSADSQVRIAMSMGLSVVGLAIVLAIRSGMKRSQGVWLAVAATLAFCLPLNLYRISHEDVHWQRSREGLERLLPPGAAVGGRWAHGLVGGTHRRATIDADVDHVLLPFEENTEGLILEHYSLFGDQQVLVRQSGVPSGTFEVACALQESGMLAEARSDLALLLRADPACSAAWERFALLLLEDGIEDLAAECLFFSLQGDPGRASCHRLLAQLYIKQGKEREALHHMTMSSGQAPTVRILSREGALSPEGRR